MAKNVSHILVEVILNLNVYPIWANSIGLTILFRGSGGAAQDALPYGHMQHEHCCFPCGSFETLPRLLTVTQTQSDHWGQCVETMTTDVLCGVFNQNS